MAIDYLHSTAGPYREILYIPGYASVHLGASRIVGLREHPRVLRGHSITQIYVSTSRSRDSGAANWGIPKEMADIAWDSARRGANRIRLSTKRGRPLLTLHIADHCRSLTFPVDSRLLPHKLVQVARALAYVTPIAGSARIGLAGPTRLKSHSSETAEVVSRTVLATFRISEFSVRFPEARTYPLARQGADREPF